MFHIPAVRRPARDKRDQLPSYTHDAKILCGNFFESTMQQINLFFFSLSLSPMNEDCATAPSKKHIMYPPASLVCTRTSTDQTQSGLCKQMGCHVLYCCSSILIGWKCNGIRVWRQESVWFRGWLTGPQPLHSSLIVYLFIQKKPFRGSTALNVSLSRSNIIMMICIQRRSCEAVSVQYGGATDGIRISSSIQAWTERTVLFWFD